MPPLDWEETVTFDLKPKPPLFKAKRTLSAVHVSHLPSLRLRKQKRSDVHELRRYSVSDFTCHVTFCESCTHTHQGPGCNEAESTCHMQLPPGQYSSCRSDKEAAGIQRDSRGAGTTHARTHAHYHLGTTGVCACVVIEE